MKLATLKHGGRDGRLVVVSRDLMRCQVVGGIARRFIGAPEEILRELEASGFEVLRSTVDVRVSDDHQDNLWALCRRA